MADTLDFALPIGQRQIPLRLHAEGAMYWPAGEVLFITDPHFGKAQHFRHAGIAVPATILDQDLNRLSRLVTQNRASKLVILGDCFHSPHSYKGSVIASLKAWRTQHADLDMVLVLGNHDLSAGPPPPELEILPVEGPYRMGPFICHHEPQHGSPTGGGYLLAGHLHPYVVLIDRDRSRMRLASFIFGPHQAILPAFGRFTGGSHYPPARHDRVFAVAQGEIVEVPTTHGRATASPP